MSDTHHRTATVCTYNDVIVDKQKQHWVEFQLRGEQGERLANMLWRAVNDATRVDCTSEYSGLSDAQGVIRVDGLHSIPITLLVAANLLAEELRTRRLRCARPEPHRPIVGEHTPLHIPQRSGFSPIEQQAIAAGHDYHYLRVAQLCDQQPSFDAPLSRPKQLPAFHFPDSTVKALKCVRSE